MDPKVCGKLLTHHQRGYGVDVEALRDRISPWQIAEKGPRMGSHGYRRLLIRLQLIYNFLLFHAIILSILDVNGLIYTLLYYFWD